MSTADTAFDGGRPVRLRALWESCTGAVSRFLIGSVPAVTGETLAVCRIAFGSSILYFWLTLTPQSLGTLGRVGPQYPIAKLIDQTGFLTFLSTSPQAQWFLYWTVISLLVAFILGIFTRVLYPLLVVLFWLTALLWNHGHFITPLLIATTATIIAPWSARWSVDSLLFGGDPGPRVASPYFGYAIWLLGLAIGLTYTSAGLSKLVMTQGAWLWETGARGGLIQDFRHAVTDWGMIITNHYWLSLGASVLSGFGQTIYVWAAFTRSPLIKYGIGLFVAFPFLIGLVLFMGLFWWPWAVLVVMLYLPWPTIDRLVTRGRVRKVPFAGTPQIGRQRTWFLSVTAIMISLQAYAVATRSEYEPIYSNYPMYADRMLAQSPYEREFWTRFKPHDRNYKYNIQVVGQNASGPPAIKDVTLSYDLAYFLRRYSLASMQISGLDPDGTLQRAAKATSLSAGYCEDLRAVAATYSPSNSQPSAVRFAKRYFDLVDGQMTWLPVESWVEVDITASGCPYREVRGDFAVAGRP